MKNLNEYIYYMRHVYLGVEKYKFCRRGITAVAKIMANLKTILGSIEARKQPTWSRYEWFLMNY